MPDSRKHLLHLVANILEWFPTVQRLLSAFPRDIGENPDEFAMPRVISMVDSQIHAEKNWQFLLSVIKSNLE